MTAPQATADETHSSLRAEMLAPAPWSAAEADGVRVTAVRTFLTGPQGCPYVVTRVETNQPGLYGLGDASDPQRPLATLAVLDEYLGPLLVGRDPADIEDLHRLLLNSGYWRGGSIEHNALAAVDLALWDLKGKVAGLPVHQLLGGRARAWADAYTHVDGADAAEVADKVLAAVGQGYRHVRVQVAVPGRDTYGTAPRDAAEAARRRTRTDRWDTLAYLRHVPAILADVRDRVGPDVELLHDAHERMTPAEARQFVRAVEDAHLYFLEDALACWIHGTRVANDPVTAPCTQNTAATATRARRTSRGPIARPPAGPSPETGWRGARSRTAGPWGVASSTAGSRTAGPCGAGIVVQRLADLNAVVTKAKTERISKEATYNQLRALQAPAAACCCATPADARAAPGWEWRGAGGRSAAPPPS
jgi:hypothetical protein